MLALDHGRLPDHRRRMETGNASSDAGHGHTLVEVTSRTRGNEAYGRIVHAVRGDVTGRVQPARSTLKSRQDDRRL